ncbi:transmembrane protein with metallophosphoesterase domain-like [Haliotis rufescens]|uniref:transmembrane protein with metallophosphoesterase domain-like n=1 Tax=Haliotis rufescens TaxID=6454 RepID=UPI00201ECAE8|nr:transmembrane protein with metallophosphoesterase domain-like [Haliotis rufescens]
MAVSLGTKVAAGVTVLLAVILSELYVFSLHWETKARMLKLQFIIFLQAFLILFSGFVWNNFSTMFDKPSQKQGLKHVKYSDNDLHQTDVTQPDLKKWTLWRIILVTYLVLCHASYFTNFYFIGREPYFIAYSCYAALGLLFQIVTGLVFVKVILFCLRSISSSKPVFSKQRELQLVLIYAILLWTYGLYNAASPPVVKEVLIPVRGLPESLDGFRIVQISDIHLGPTVGRWRLTRIVNIINEQNADVVVMTGDLVDGSVVSLREAVEPVKDIQSKFGKYFITGNHEYYTGDVDNWFSHLRGLGFIVLHNSNVRLPSEKLPTKQQICLAGTDDIEALRIGYGNHGMRLDDALGSCDQSQPVILLAHQLKAAKTALDSEYRVDVVLSGHTHGGQIFPVMIGSYFLHPFFYGLYRYGESSHVYVSMGTQYFGIPVRIGTTMEVTRIILTQAP